MAVSDRFSKARPRSSYPHCGCLGSSLTHCSFSCQSWAGGWDLRMAAKNVGPHRSPTASQVTTPTADGQGLCLLQQHEVPLRESSDCGWGGVLRSQRASARRPGVHPGGQRGQRLSLCRPGPCSQPSTGGGPRVWPRKGRQQARENQALGKSGFSKPKAGVS